MDFLRINSAKIKITMSRAECDRYGIYDKGGDYDARLVREVLSDILEDAGAEGFAKIGEKLLVQIYPRERGGAEIFVTKLAHLGEREKKAISTAENLTTYNKERAAFLFESAADLYGGARHIDKPLCSDLYLRSDGKYLLILDEEQIGGMSDVEILSEYGERVSLSLVTPSPEWDKLLASGDAIARLHERMRER